MRLNMRRDCQSYQHATRLLCFQVSTERQQVVKTMWGGCVSALLATAVAASEDRVAADSIYRLQQEAWVITQKADRVESRAGLPPYQHLVRRVAISTYRLGRGDRALTCEIIYDSQRDRQQEVCGPIVSRETN